MEKNLMANSTKKDYTLDSREVAEMVGKRHDHLMRDIDSYIQHISAAPKIGVGDFFLKSQYFDKNKQERPCYQITKKGCEFIANKLTGEKGAVFTAVYINKFHEMEQELTGSGAVKRVAKEKLSSINNAARTILPVMEKAGMKPEYQFYLLRQLYGKAGVELPMERFEQESKLYDKTAIAKILGVMSQNGNPHAQAIGAILTKVGIEDEEKELTSFERNGHTGVEYQYKESVIGKVSDWLTESNYPLMISAKGKNYKVHYSLLSEVH
ncbi:MAG: Rha family transcriptional regulator [Peptostreptococcaceae bacterium]|nr:Rha family transcriptional regulator [Peptostreptococcaceae bacterium]